MTEASISLKIPVDHGCLVLRGIGAEDDLSDWDPELDRWHRNGNSIIFAVASSVDGSVVCNIWKSAPPRPLPIHLLTSEIESRIGTFVLHDVAERNRIEFRIANGRISVTLLVDSIDSPNEVQVCFGEEVAVGGL